MKRPTFFLTAALLVPGAAAAQQPARPPVRPEVIDGIRLDVVATGEVARAPDIVVLSAGIVTRAPTAEAALRDNAARMESVRAVLARAGVQPRDIQTGSISLSQDFRQTPDGVAQPIGYSASNQLTVRFREIARAGRIIDALVAAGANNVAGPSFDIDNRAAATDEARVRALAVARARADLYARAIGARVRRVVAISEGGAASGPVYSAQAFARSEAADTRIEPGELQVGATVTVTFELDQPGG